MEGDRNGKRFLENIYLSAMSEVKEIFFFGLIIVFCILSLLLTFYTFVILPKTNVALGSFF